MNTRYLKMLPLLACGVLFTATLSLAQDPPAPSSAASKQQAAPQTKPVGTKSRKRSRRAIPSSQNKPAVVAEQPAAAAAATAQPSPAPTASPVPVEPPAAPEAASDSSTTEPLSEEKHPRAKSTTELTRETRLREQLKVVEQMVAQGLKQEALAELHLLAAEDRYDPQGFYNIANAFARLDASDAAITAYRKAIEQRNGRYSRALNNLGVILLRQGFWDQAYEAFVSALRIENFRYAEASYNLGRLYAARGEKDRAFREWKRAVTVDPDHAAAARALGNVRTVSAISPAPSSPAPSSPAPAAPSKKATTAEIAPSVKMETSSLKVASAESYTLNPEVYSLMQQGRVAHERGRYQEALINFRLVISRMGGYFSPANLELSYSLISLRRNDEAITELLRVAEKDGARFPISYYHLGRLYELRGDLKLAEENYLLATESYQSENAQFLLNLSMVREKRGDFAGALAAMENYIKRKEQQGQKPDWSDARLASLREKAGASKP